MSEKFKQSETVGKRWGRIKTKNAILDDEIKRLLAKDEEIRRKKFIFFYDEGIKELNRRNYKQSIKNFELALKIDPKHRSAQKYLIEAISAEMEYSESAAKIIKNQNQNKISSDAKIAGRRSEFKHRKQKDRDIAMIFTKNLQIVTRRRAARIRDDLYNGFVDRENLKLSLSERMISEIGTVDEGPHGSVPRKREVATNT